MTITNKHKAYAAIVGVGILALVIDRVYFTPPSAAAAPAPAEAIIHPGAKSDAPVPDSAAEGTIAARLKSVVMPDLRNLCDAFSPSNAWIAVAQPVPEDFKATHKLTAVLASHSGGGGAIVNGQMIKLGQTLDGFTLTAIQARTVEFTKGGNHVELSVGF